MIQLIKLLVEPIAIIWLVVIIIAIFQFLKKQKTWGILSALLALGIWIIGASPIPMLLIATLEKPYSVEKQSEYPKVDVVVVLGGIIKAAPNEYTGINVNGAFDRMITGIDIVKKGKAEILLYCGGKPGELGEAASRYEAMDSIFKGWNLSDIEFENLGFRTNTREEALAVSEYLGVKKKVGLVTSAWHMPRSESAFRAVGIDVIPIPCDFYSGSKDADKAAGFRLVPGLGGFEILRIYIYEMAGRVYYKFKF